MAYGAKRINPIDLEKRRAVGITVPLSGKAVFNSSYETKDAIKSNLINFILTGKGERYFNPSFGSGIRNLIFANINRDNLTSIELLIREEILTYFPNLNIKELILTSAVDDNTVLFSLKFSIRDTEAEDEITINFEQ
jgi:phage baseplate assembly protein W